MDWVLINSCLFMWFKYICKDIVWYVIMLCVNLSNKKLYFYSDIRIKRNDDYCIKIKF